MRLRVAAVVMFIGLALLAASLIRTSAPGDQWTPQAAEQVSVPGEIRRHPDDDYLVRPEGLPFHVLTAEAAVLPEPFQRWIDQLLAATEVASIGLLEGPDAFLFGEVGDVALAADRLFVLDEQLEEVRVFSTAGEHVVTLGGPGQGPGEFMRPNALAIEPESMGVWVGDETRRFIQYSLENDLPRFLGTLQVDAEVEDVCFAGLAAIAYAPMVFGGEPLRRITSDGDAELFGLEAYGSPSVQLNYALGRDGIIACGPTGTPASVFHASSIGEIRAYGALGEPLWVTAIEDFIGPDARELENGRFAMVARVYSSRVVGLSALGTGALLVQVSQMERREAGWREEIRLDSYLLDPVTGAGSYVGADLPLVVAARPGLVITLENIEYPRIAVLETGVVLS